MIKTILFIYYVNKKRFIITTDDVSLLQLNIFIFMKEFENLAWSGQRKIHVPAIILIILHGLISVDYGFYLFLAREKNIFNIIKKFNQKHYLPLLFNLHL